MGRTASFPLFPCLPPELRLKVWEAAQSSPSMHLFDVCMPAENDDNSDKERPRTQITFREKAVESGTESDARRRRYDAFKDTVFFDAHRGVLPEQEPRTDPSMYKWKMSLVASCIDAFHTTLLSKQSRQHISSSSAPSFAPGAPSAIFDSAVNTVYLPGPDRRIQYDNQADILHLCFPKKLPGRPVAATAFSHSEAAPALAAATSADHCCGVKSNTPLPPAAGSGSDLEIVPDPAPGLLDVQWSNELAETLRTARRIAINAAQTACLVDMAGVLADDEIAMLASTLQCGLEVLYLVDYRRGRCRDCGWPERRAKDLATRGELYEKLNPDGPVGSPAVSPEKPSSVFGVGCVYREVFDLEQLGWTEQHTAFIFGRALGAAIRQQQADIRQACFQGVRVLVVEDE